MADRVVSIEIGAKITKVVETEHRSGNVMYQGFMFDNPADINENGIIKATDQFCECLKEQLKSHKIKTKKVVFVIQASSIGTKEEVLPKMRENRFADYINTNKSTFFPISPEKYDIVYRENGKTEDGKPKVQLYAIPKDIIQSYERLAEKCQWTIADMEILDDGVAQSLVRKEQKGVVANVTVEMNCSILTILKDGVLDMQRVIPYGVHDAVEAIMTGNVAEAGKGYVGTLEVMENQKCFYDHLGGPEEQEEESPLADLATEEVRYVIGNITRILDYYKSQHSGVIIEKFILSGLGSACKGFANLLSNEVEGQLFTAEETLMSDVVNKGNVANVGAYFTGLAGCVDPIKVKFSSKKSHGLELKRVERDEEDFSMAKKVFILCILITIALIAFPMAYHFRYAKEQKALQTEINSLQEAKEIAEQHTQVQAKYNDAMRIVELSKTANDDYVELLQDMEAKLPSEAAVTALSADSSAVVIDFMVPNKEVAAATISAFRSIACVQNVSTSAVNASGEEGSTGYVFTITCNYTGTAAVDADGQATEESTEDSSDASAEE